MCAANPFNMHRPLLEEMKLLQLFRKPSVEDRPKVFCIGRNKTGTTTMAKVFQMFGYRLGDQQEGELFIEDWARRDFRGLIEYCKKSDAFQDSPFSRLYTYQALDAAFPGSKFILTVRDSSEQWYESATRFHRMRNRERLGKDCLPSAEDIKSDPYIYEGYLWRVRELVTGVTDENNLWNKDKMIAEYELHNQQVRDYFRHRPHDLLEINVAHSNAMERLCQFLGEPYTGQVMPRENSSN
jgi:hypothetical protein